MSTSVSNGRLKQELNRISKDLHESVLTFWLRYSPDQDYGGYFNNLDRDGAVWDTRKHVWLQARQVWMMSAVYNTTKDSRYLEAATPGVEFLRRHARTTDNRVYFCLTREGKPVYMQRKIFSECFYVMALAEYARASASDEIRSEARKVFESVLKFRDDPTLVGRPVYEGVPPASSLAIPMILLNLVDILHEPGESTYSHIEEWCVEQIKLHVKPELKLVLEHVAPDGSLMETPEGRIVNPGHAIEAGWFLLDYARRIDNAELKKLGINIIDWSFDSGWDDEFEGLYYFLDREGYSPPALEWNMKLWWPHCEAMIGFLMAYQTSGDARHFERFVQVLNYCHENFADPEHGEWFGYLDRHGKLTHRFKGGAYKGCFHVPRALWRCEGMLRELLSQ